MEETGVFESLENDALVQLFSLSIFRIVSREYPDDYLDEHKDLVLYTIVSTIEALKRYRAFRNMPNVPQSQMS